MHSRYWEESYYTLARVFFPRLSVRGYAPSQPENVRTTLTQAFKLGRGTRRRRGGGVECTEERWEKMRRKRAALRPRLGSRED
eukprot:216007-Rhodomonas_salina.1